ncbi:hypothetical protein TUMSATVNIG1_25240 [Vibrio nigripulchritudo]|uniref:hypothetical protein n=1 Tax=Vibrio nigripulchritudo TaxID=28173 RepID=UPI00190E044A|nr:hypothetical protein [Vibrio nigripulchritudo]BCL70561.1 hypothetical protein VNTUMSATTG_24980 [Vibrio nigripulchritudo]BDU31915.1 hypothetical protein TUMSATVNIG1_25240 [Vibrio nigripulchritudo]
MTISNQTHSAASTSNTTWLHGTEVKFDSWVLPIPTLKHKKGMEAHSAVFFTLSDEYAEGCSYGTGGLVSTTIVPGSKVLDLNTCSDEESEKFRLHLLTKPTASKNLQYQSTSTWKESCKTGSIMKFAPTEEEQDKYFLKYHAAMSPTNSIVSAIEQRRAWNELQLLTRANIEDVVQTGAELGYDCVITNEIDTLRPGGSVAFPIMFALNTSAITSPSWISLPKKTAEQVARIKEAQKKAAAKKKKKNKKKQVKDSRKRK